MILLVMLWFAIGTQRNIRKGNEILNWLQTGLPMLINMVTMETFGFVEARFTRSRSFRSS